MREAQLNGPAISALAMLGQTSRLRQVRLALLGSVECDRVLFTISPRVLRNIIHAIATSQSHPKRCAQGAFLFWLKTRSEKA